VTSLEQGGRYFGVYLAVVRDQDGGPTPADEAKLAAAKTEAARLGYDVQRGLSCDDGAVAGLGLDPSRNYDSVQVYFATAADAQQFVDLYQPGVVGTAQVQTFCLD
jgi:hypothetical protein